MNDDKVIVILNIKRLSKKYDVEVPLYITANDLVKRDSWRFEHFNNTFLKDINAVEKWLIESLEKQNNRSLAEEPYLLAEHIKDKRRIIKNSLYKLKQVKKPKESRKKRNYLTLVSQVK